MNLTFSILLVRSLKHVSKLRGREIVINNYFLIEPHRDILILNQISLSSTNTASTQTLTPKAHSPTIATIKPKSQTIITLLHSIRPKTLVPYHILV